MALLEINQGVLGKRLAAHLLRRATYNFNAARIEEFSKLTAAQAVNRLFVYEPLKFKDGPLSWNNNKPIYSLEDRLGGERVNDPEIAAIVGRGSFCHAWKVNEAIEDTTAKWKVIHWMNAIFRISFPNGNDRAYHYWRLLEHLSFDSMKTLAVKVTVDNGMLHYLNNNKNFVDEPNENYAREFLELFTIQKGEAIGVGNYTNYTEADISTAAKVLTGFVVSNALTDPETGIARGYAKFSEHDTTNKTFSAAFQNKVITGATSSDDMHRELADFVDMIFEQKATAQAYARKMYRFFVSDNITDEIESDIINPLANQLLSNGYQHITVLKRLMRSKHFYDMDDSDNKDEIIGGKIKSPRELMFQSINIFDVPGTSGNDYEKYFYRDFYAFGPCFLRMGMSINGPPTVEGFSGYFKDPGYSRNWYLNNYLYARYSVGDILLSGRRIGNSGYFPRKLDIVQWVNDNLYSGVPIGTPQAAQGAANAEMVVRYFIDMLLPEEPGVERFEYFMDSLLGGLSPINWYFSWKQYIEENDSSDVKVGLERLFKTLMTSPEYQTF